MLIFPKAKINIGLRITGKRSDGYHNIETVFYPVCLCDALEFVVPPEKIEKDIFRTTGIDIACSDENNLVLKALKRLREVRNIPFLRIHLHKAIPAGAGLGGGSSDAAFFLRLLNRYFNFGFDIPALKDIALSIGSDCPFFIEPQPAYAEGRGEIITPARQLEGYYIVLLNPGIDITTSEAYSECVPSVTEKKLIDCYNENISKWKDLIMNDFEKTVFRRHPVIGSIKDKLYKTGALYSSMSGSGSTVYGIFDHEPVIPETMAGMVVYSGIL